MRKNLVVGNWKMNGDKAQNEALLQSLSTACIAEKVTVAVCAPFPYLAQCQQVLDTSCMAWGAQDVSEHDAGAFTGDVSASMLVDFGCQYVIVGHSERRALHGESDEVVAQKARQALNAGITPIVCVGETADEQESGLTHAVVSRQLAAVIDLLAGDTTSIVLAYEPVWAIGTGKNATPAQAQAVHAQLRAQLIGSGAGDVPILYGGSVKADNARELFSESDIDGGLIGGASLKSEDFLAIIQAAIEV
ncbi:Triosephosphate isomerase [Saezia sanguinis]|uniref:Triosephosphate isomerase n=1 Tax=Saezia sanguinis TaxID=1965230 RepID=A0A433SH81_9BURK|nr:triose-phosphate isomerase [Saezia sanguinis]RUS68050.1 Triosephosphate isomerase [Saezia sanguinis]